MADLRGGARNARPPGSKFLHFHAVFGKNWPNNRLAPPPLGLVPPPLGNPGSATEYKSAILTCGVLFGVFKPNFFVFKWSGLTKYEILIISFAEIKLPSITKLLLPGYFHNFETIFEPYRDQKLSPLFIYFQIKVFETIFSVYRV